MAIDESEFPYDAQGWDQFVVAPSCEHAGGVMRTQVAGSGSGPTGGGGGSQRAAGSRPGEKESCWEGAARSARQKAEGASGWGWIRWAALEFE
jgi:hypothetical protein